ncbi:hypothetical protein KKF84_20435, partial [Myxococcota bacterium]|nr:hypothetical protein [Myxococcota bacterium]MBU1537693.1 hypothetical protein [Myxococcota bacterium]
MKTIMALLLPLVCFIAACDDDSGNNNNNKTFVCGNGVVEVGETCDGTALDNQTCETLGQGFTGGV